MRLWMAGMMGLCVALGPASAQTGDERDLTRSMIQAERRAMVTSTMQLDEAQAGLFWPLYDAYREAMGLVNERAFKLLDDYVAAYSTLTDDQAAKLLDEWLDIERDALRVRSHWVKKFRKELPARVVTRFFQLDNKLDAVIRAELARVVPLAR